MVRFIAVSGPSNAAEPLGSAFGLALGAAALLLVFLLAILALTAARRMRSGSTSGKRVSDEHQHIDAWAMAGVRTAPASDSGEAGPGDDTVDLDPGDRPPRDWQ